MQFFEASLHLLVTITEGIVQLNCDHFEADKSVCYDEYRKNVSNGRRNIRQQCEGQREDVQKQERARHLYEGERVRRR